MSRNLLRRFALLLAGAKYSRAELRELLLELSHHDPASVLDLVDLLRSQSLSEHALSPREQRHDFSPRVSGPSSQEPEQQIDRLLRREGKLTTSEAMDRLARALIREGVIAEKDIPPLNKDSFTSWLRRLSQRVPPSALLHFASVIRNDLVDSKTDAWPLSSPKNEK